MTSRKNVSLEERCRQVLEIIRNFKREKNTWPSEREILNVVGLKSISNINKILSRLEEEGEIERVAGKARGISIPGFEDQIYSIPLKGIIAANNLNPAIVFDEDTTSMVEVTPAMIRERNHAKIFALTVQGNSMEEAAILDGDTVFLLEGDQWRDGDIVAVWLKNEEGMTLKKIYEGRPGVIKLQPASHNHNVRVEYQDDIRVLGKLVGMMRTF